MGCSLAHFHYWHLANNASDARPQYVRSEAVQLAVGHSVLSAAIVTPDHSTRQAFEKVELDGDARARLAISAGTAAALLSPESCTMSCEVMYSNESPSSADSLPGLQVVQTSHGPDQDYRYSIREVAH